MLCENYKFSLFEMSRSEELVYDIITMKFLGNLSYVIETLEDWHERREDVKGFYLDLNLTYNMVKELYTYVDQIKLVTTEPNRKALAAFSGIHTDMRDSVMSQVIRKLFIN